METTTIRATIFEWRWPLSELRFFRVDGHFYQGYVFRVANGHYQKYVFNAESATNKFRGSLSEGRLPFEEVVSGPEETLKLKPHLVIRVRHHREPEGARPGFGVLDPVQGELLGDERAVVRLCDGEVAVFDGVVRRPNAPGVSPC